MTGWDRVLNALVAPAQTKVDAVKKGPSMTDNAATDFKAQAISAPSTSVTYLGEDFVQGFR